MAMEHMVENLKKHPYLLGAGVFVVGVLLIFIIFGGNKATAPTATQATSDTQGATQLAMAQLQAQALVHQSDNALAATQNTNAAQLQAIQTQAVSAVNADQIQFDATKAIALANDATQAQVATIQANVLQSQIGANLSAIQDTNDTTFKISNVNAKLAAFKDSDATQLAMLQNQNATNLAHINADYDYNETINAQQNATNLAHMALDRGADPNKLSFGITNSNANSSSTSQFAFH